MKYSHDQFEKAFEHLKKFYANEIPEGIASYHDMGKLILPHPLMGKFNDALERMNKPIIPRAGKIITHPLDIEYFTEYAAPLMELMHSSHYTNVNSTIAFFGPMLYFLTRAIGAEHVLEIGMAQGYTSWYLANAIKDNAVRYGMAGNMYYGIDIIDVSESIKKHLDAASLPNRILQMDSINLTPDTFKGVTFDIIFQDGAHDTEHVVKEIEILYPQLKGEGNGFLICHDVYGPAEEGVHKIIEDPRYNWEYIRICEIYGIAILRKMDGYKEGKRWVE